MDEIAHGQRIQNERILAAFRGRPAQTVAPDEAERIAQQLAKRAGRLGPVQNGPSSTG